METFNTLNGYEVEDTKARNNKQNKIYRRKISKTIVCTPKQSIAGTITTDELGLAENECVVFGVFNQGFKTNTLFESIVYTYELYTESRDKVIDYRIYNNSDSEYTVDFVLDALLTTI